MKDLFFTKKRLEDHWEMEKKDQVIGKRGFGICESNAFLLANHNLQRYSLWTGSGFILGYFCGSSFAMWVVSFLWSASCQTCKATVDGRNPASPGCIKPCKYWDKLFINWCRISSINSIVLLLKTNKVFAYQPNSLNSSTSLGCQSAALAQQCCANAKAGSGKVAEWTSCNSICRVTATLPQMEVMVQVFKMGTNVKSRFLRSEHDIATTPKYWFVRGKKYLAQIQIQSDFLSFSYFTQRQGAWTYSFS